MKIQNALLLIIAFGILAKFWGFTKPWGTKDHYNYGGIYMNWATRCMAQTPLSESRGVVHTNCESGEPQYYVNHPPGIIFGLMGLTKIFGDHEWVYRLFTVIFSILNIFLVFKLGRTIWPVGSAPLWAAAFQASTLGNMYFGTHIDFIGEFTISFILLSAYFLRKGNFLTSLLLALVAGLSAWPGYIMLAVIFVYEGLLAVLSPRQRGNIPQNRVAFEGKEFKKLIIAGLFCFLGFFMILATLSYLSKAPNVVQFLIDRLTPKYQADQVTSAWYLLPFLFLKNIIQSLSRLLGPFLAAIIFYELSVGKFWLDLKNFRLRISARDPFVLTFLSVVGVWVLFAAVGYRGMMVHVFEYLFLIPALALMFGRFADGFVGTRDNSYSGWKYAPQFTAIVAVAFYPYGIYQSSRIHDVINSVVLISTALLWGIWFNKVSKSGRKDNFRSGFLILFSIATAANFSQVINYRTEPDSERPVCAEARQKYLQRQADPLLNAKQKLEPIAIDAHFTFAKAFYCAGVPVRYLK